MTDPLPTQIGPYRNRIIGLRVMPARDLLDNPRNWRKYPEAQAQGLDAVMRRIGAIDLDLPEPVWRGCPAGQYSVAITSDGKAKGCLTLPDDAIEGDLRQDDLWSIWFRDDAFAYTRQYSPEQIGAICKGCALADQCRGGCSSMSCVCTGSFHNDPYCFYGIQKRNPEAFGLKSEV